MAGKLRNRGRVVLACLVVLASGVATFGARVSEPQVLSATDAVALRFPSAEPGAVSDRLAALGQVLHARRAPTLPDGGPVSMFDMPLAALVSDAFSLFNPTLSYPAVAKSSAAPADAGSKPGQRASHPARVFNDAQIASIKKRLNLTPEQERMWPAVERALRDLAYKKKPGSRDSARLAYFDPAGAEVRELKSAAFPLIMRLSDEQKRELRGLAHVAGLDGIASKF